MELPLEEMGVPELIDPFVGKFLVTDPRAFALEALGLKQGSYVTVQLQGAIPVPPAAEAARVDIALPPQALVVGPGLTKSTFKLWDANVAAAIERMLLGGTASGGRVVHWYVWDPEAELIECHGWGSPKPITSISRRLNGWRDQLASRGVIRRASDSPMLLIGVGLAVVIGVPLVGWAVNQLSR